MSGAGCFSTNVFQIETCQLGANQPRATSAPGGVPQTGQSLQLPVSALAAASLGPVERSLRRSGVARFWSVLEIASDEAPSFGAYVLRRVEVMQGDHCGLDQGFC